MLSGVNVISHDVVHESEVESIANETQALFIVETMMRVVCDPRWKSLSFFRFVCGEAFWYAMAVADFFGRVSGVDSADDTRDPCRSDVVVVSNHP